MRSVVLHIEAPKSDEGYQVTLHKVREDGGVEDATASGFMPADWSEETNFVTAANGDKLSTPEQIREEILRQDVPAESLKSVGQFLYGLLLREPVLGAWKQLEAEGRQGDGLRTYLDIDPPELRLLPWELLNDAEPTPALFLDAKLSLVRGRPVNLEENPCQLPIRVLIVVACAPDDDEIDWKEELKGIKVALRAQRQLIDWKILKTPTRQQLVEQYKQYKPHVFHFIGHGLAGGDSEAFLEFSSADAGGARWKWKLEDILLDLQHHKPNLAFINACHSARPESRSSTWSIAHAFVTLGARAVLAVQGAISGAAAAVLGGEVYRHFTLGNPIDKALWEARLAIKQTQEFVLAGDWCLPSLMLNTPPDLVLPIKWPITIREWEDILAENRMLTSFVDREEQRRQIWGTLNEGKAPQSGVLILKGMELVGKTMMLRWCLEACKVQRHQVVYRNCRGSNRMDFVELLRFIRDGVEDWSHTVEEKIKPAELFAPFNRRLNELLAPAGADVPPATDQDLGFVLSNAGGHENMFESMADEFLKVLAEVAGQGFLTVALDHVDEEYILDTHFKNYFLPYILRRVSRNEVEKLRIIVAASDKQYETMGLERLPRADQYKMEIQPFDREDFCTLAVDYLSCYHDDLEDINKLVNTIYEIKIANASTWMPEELDFMAKVFK